MDSSSHPSGMSQLLQDLLISPFFSGHAEKRRREENDGVVFCVEGGYSRNRRRLLKQHEADRQKAILALRLQQRADRYTAPRRARLQLQL